MQILFVADIVGGPGRKVVSSVLPLLLKKHNIDFCIANGENAAGGYGLTTEIADELFGLGVDVITSGNHIWDRKEMLPELDRYSGILRPVNYPPNNPGHGTVVRKAKNGIPVAVVNLQGRVFMKEIDCPFRTISTVLESIRAESGIVIVDFHAEASAEKVAMGWYLDGRVSAVLGTHTHVQTADERILPAGTAYITDAGMSGSIDGVIGIKKELAIKRFLLQTPNRFQPADTNLVMMGVVLKVDPQTGKAVRIERFQVPQAAALAM